MIRSSGARYRNNRNYPDNSNINAKLTDSSYEGRPWAKSPTPLLSLLSTYRTRKRRSSLYMQKEPAESKNESPSIRPPNRDTTHKSTRYSNSGTTHRLTVSTRDTTRVSSRQPTQGRVTLPNIYIHPLARASIP